MRHANVDDVLLKRDWMKVIELVNKSVLNKEK